MSYIVTMKSLCYFSFSNKSSSILPLVFFPPLKVYNLYLDNVIQKQKSLGQISDFWKKHFKERAFFIPYLRWGSISLWLKATVLEAGYLSLNSFFVSY